MVGIIDFIHLDYKNWESGDYRKRNTIISLMQVSNKDIGYVNEKCANYFG